MRSTYSSLGEASQHRVRLWLTERVGDESGRLLRYRNRSFEALNM